MMRPQFELRGYLFITVVVAMVACGAVLTPCASAQKSAQPEQRQPSGRLFPAVFSFVDSGQALGNSTSWSVSLADADGDGDLDAFVGNWHPQQSEHSCLWLNAGNGHFDASSQQFPPTQTLSPGDLDGDGDVDIWFGGHPLAGQDDSQVWLNDGQARFTRTDQALLTGNNAVGDFDGDGDLDSMVTNYHAGVRVYLNDGSAHFTASATDLDFANPGTLAVGDLDGDGDLDAYVTGVSDDTFVAQPDRVLFNDGQAGFVDSGQAIGEYQGISVALGDVDGDGDLDALLGNAHDAPDPSNPPQPFMLYLNNGLGLFAPSGLDLGEAREGVATLADLDRDGDLDAVLFKRDPMTETGTNRVLINNGTGRFVYWGIEFGSLACPGGAVGDLDGDGDLDIFSASVMSQPNLVWINIPPISFPVEPSVLVSRRFQRSEGIAFNGEGELFVTANWALWRVSTQGDVEWVAEMDSNLGLAPIGDRDLLVADFGPTNAFAHGPNSDGIVWRITPDGGTTVAASGIGDPNFIVVLEDGSFLVSDDAVHEIWIVDPGGTVRLFTTTIGHPNGLLVSEDRTTLYVAQIFESINPIVWDNRIWALPLAGSNPAGPPELLTTTGNDQGPDGMAMDVLGRIYVALNLAGKILRINPDDGSSVLIAENMPGVASLAFGQGSFDPNAIFATSTSTGRVWEVYVGIAGAELHR